MKACRHPLYNLEIPRVVGTILTRETLFGPMEAIRDACDIAELRLDGMASPEGCLRRARELEDAGQPMLFTVRLERDGGSWADEREGDRGELLETALSSLSLVDVEVQSTLRGTLCKQAKRLRKRIIISYHDFARTPGLVELKERVAEAVEPYPEGAICKIATFTRTEDDVAVLRELLCSTSSRICVLGMGPLGPSTRLDMPLAGSCLTYGYIDKQSAPGQQAGRTLVQELSRRRPDYAAARAHRSAFASELCRAGGDS